MNKMPVPKKRKRLDVGLFFVSAMYECLIFPPSLLIQNMRRSEMWGGWEGEEGVWAGCWKAEGAEGGWGREGGGNASLGKRTQRFCS